MLSLNKRIRGYFKDGIIPAGADRRALPRALKWPLALRDRISDTSNGNSRSFLVAILVGGGIVFAGAFSASSGGHAMLASMSTSLGFTISEIRINGIHEIHRDHVRIELAATKNTPILSYDVHAARDRLNELAWVKDVSVTKIYPDTIAVDIKERQPFAVWQSEGKLNLIERDGEVIVPFEAKFARLPIVVGEGANKSAAQFLNEMAKHPRLMKEAKAYVRVADRRWDIDLKNGVKVMLPETNLANALTRIGEMEESHMISKRDVVALDFRLEGKMVMRLTPEAAKRREAEQKVKQASGSRI